MTNPTDTTPVSAVIPVATGTIVQAEGAAAPVVVSPAITNQASPSFIINVMTPPAPAAKSVQASKPASASEPAKLDKASTKPTKKSEKSAVKSADKTDADHLKALADVLERGIASGAVTLPSFLLQGQYCGDDITRPLVDEGCAEANASVMSNPVTNPEVREMIRRGLLQEKLSHNAAGEFVYEYSDTEGKLVYWRDRTTGANHVILNDPFVEIRTQTDKGGFTGHRYYPRDYDAAERFAISATPGSSSSSQGDVTCDDGKIRDGWWFDSDSQTVSNPTVDEVTARELKDFLIDHSALGDLLKTTKLPIASLGGHSVNIDEIQRTPAIQKACPVTEEGVIIRK